MSIPVGGSGAEVALWGGKGLMVRSNNENAVSNPLPPERLDGELRIFRLVGLNLNETTLLEFGRGSMKEGHWQWDPGSPWPGCLQVRVTATAKVKQATDDLITLEKPHMALNMPDVYSYQMQFNPPIYKHTTAQQIVDAVNAVGKLKHLVFACHGQIDYDANKQITNSRIYCGAGFTEVELFSQFKNLAGGVIWMGACGIGNDDERNKKRAVNGRCYLVAPVFYMSPKPGLLKGGRSLPYGKLDMFARFSPKVVTPEGNLLGFSSFLKMGKQLGFSV